MIEMCTASRIWLHLILFASDGTIAHPSCMSCRPTPRSCAHPHTAWRVATERWQGVHWLVLGVPVGLTVTVVARARRRSSQRPGQGDLFSRA